MRRSARVWVLHPNPRQEPSMTQVSPLRRRMIEDMTVRNLSPATQQSYVYAVTKFGQFFKRSPERLDLEDVRAFQVHLVAGGISWSALNQTVSALRFLYGVTLGRPDLPERIPHAREPRKLPVVLSADEVVRFLEAVPSLKCRAALTTAYAAGLRAAEVASLKVANIDSSRMVIRVEQGSRRSIVPDTPPRAAACSISDAVELRTEAEASSSQPSAASRAVSSLAWSSQAPNAARWSSGKALAISCPCAYSPNGSPPTSRASSSKWLS